MKIYKEKNGYRLFAIGNDQVIEIEPFYPSQIKEDVRPKKYIKKNESSLVSNGKYRIEPGSITWSMKYQKCEDCQTTDNPYKSNGRCEKCYSKFHATQIKEKRKTNRLYGRENEKKAKAIDLKSWKCTECDHEFESTLPKLDIICPNCEDIHCVQV